MTHDAFLYIITDFTISFCVTKILQSFQFIFLKQPLFQIYYLVCDIDFYRHKREMQFIPQPFHFIVITKLMSINKLFIKYHIVFQNNNHIIFHNESVLIILLRDASHFGSRIIEEQKES